jgi:hypothetical protein
LVTCNPHENSTLSHPAPLSAVANFTNGLLMYEYLQHTLGNVTPSIGPKVERTISCVCLFGFRKLLSAAPNSPPTLNKQNAHQLDVFAKYSNATKLAVALDKISLTLLSRRRGIYCFATAMRWRCKTSTSVYSALSSESDSNTHWRAAKHIGQ